MPEWEYAETCDGHYARLKSNKGKTIGPMTRREAQALVNELNKQHA